MADEQTEQTEPMRFIVSGIDLTDVQIKNEEQIVPYTQIDVENMCYSDVKDKKVPKKKEAEKGQSDEKAEEKDQEYKQVNITYSYPSEDEDKPPKEKPFLYTGYEV